MYDVIIIGAGVSGSAVARELSRYKLKTCVLEKCEDVNCGTSKANSAIVHAGFDAAEGSLMAKLNVQGNELMWQLAKDLDFPVKQIGSLVVCKSEEDMPNLQKLYDRGIKNGVKGLKILSKDEVLAMEPNVTDKVVAALYAPTAGIVDPFLLNIAMAENACVNGVEFYFNTQVTGIEKVKKDGSEYFVIHTNTKDYETRLVVNAAGVYSDEIHNMVSQNKIKITPRKGEYYLLDRETGDHVKHTIFNLPNKYGKGVLVSPTVHGNIIVGPTALDITDKEGIDTTRAGLDEVAAKAGDNVRNLPLKKVITSFAGLRAHWDGHEFIIGECPDCKGFIDCSAIESPGLTSCPAIGIMVADIVADILKPEKNPDFNGLRKGTPHFAELSNEERNELIKKDPLYARIICRCETITEGEIVDCIRRPIGATTLDGVKRRTRAGMGRCQAGFCTPRTMEILARELKMNIIDVAKTNEKSKIIAGTNKDTL